MATTAPAAKKQNLLPVVVGIFCLLIVVVTLLVKGTLTSDQKYFFKILFALGCAGVAAIIPGFFHIKYRNFISAGGALAVFLFVYRYNPVTAAERFDYSIYLKDKATEKVIGSQAIQVRLQLANDRPVAEWSERSGGYKFFNIPPEFRGQTINVTMSEGSGWTFADGKSATQLVLQGDYSDMYLSRNCIIAGTVLKDTAGVKGEEGVSVYLQQDPTYQTTTDGKGNFRLNVSSVGLPAPYTLIFSKDQRMMTYQLDCGTPFMQKLLR
ncbi:MAG: hypothetical protein EOO06_14125 [Chitinophagaceae bacterium]|nr:MAG: hypothetical protein EOO06_14125 [Chitinophagaceae bacterium]